MQHKLPERLPKKLQDWKFLPIWLRSLKPYDSFIRKNLCCLKCCRKLAPATSSNSIDLNLNKNSQIQYIEASVNKDSSQSNNNSDYKVQ